MYELSNLEILVRIGMAIICGSAIGFEREAKGHNAGLRTHMLVSVGSAIIAMVQMEASYDIITMVLENPDLENVLTTDFNRLTAQIVSGIGFLGAGTIIVTKRNVSGLTTAASIWAIAGIGIAVGMGYYFLAIVSTLAVLIVLRIIKRLFGAPNVRLVNIKYTGKHTHIELSNYFVDHHIKVFSEEHSLEYSKDDVINYSNYYSIGLPEEMEMTQLIDDVIAIKDVHHISTLKEK